MCPSLSGEEWQLRRRGTGEVLAATSSRWVVEVAATAPSRWPVGRQAWRVVEGVCGEAHTRNLTLTRWAELVLVEVTLHHKSQPRLRYSFLQ